MNPYEICKDGELELTYLKSCQEEQLRQFQELSKRFSLVKMNGKKPIEKGWTKYCHARREFDDIGFRLGDNAGIACGPASGVLVVDVDKPDQFDQLIKKRGWSLPETFTVQTGSGKPHYYYQYPQNDRRYKSKNFEGIFDVKGDGGAVLAPGSIHPKTRRPYTVFKDVPIAPAPQWLLDQVEDVLKKNKEHAVLQDNEVIPEGARNNTLTSLAGKMRYWGMNMEEINAALNAVNEGRCDPPLDQDEVSQIARSVNRYEPQARLISVTGKLGAAKSSEKIEELVQVFKDACEIEDFRKIELPKRDWLIKPLIYEGQLGMIFAPPGVGKTWFALALGIGISSGGEIFGPYSVPEPRGVIYVDAEMPATELQERINSFWIDPNPKLFKVFSSDWLAAMEGPTLNISDPNWREAILQFMKNNKIFRVLILDNLSSLTPGCDESTRMDWDPINQWLIELRRIGVTVILVHHAGKSGDQRGTSAREDQLDFILKLIPIGNSTSFRVDFKKARSLFVEYKNPFSLELKENSEEKLELVYKPIEKESLYHVAALADEGLPQTEIANRLNIGQGTVSKKIKKARREGLLDDQKRLTDRGKKSCAAISPDEI